MFERYQALLEELSRVAPEEREGWIAGHREQLKVWHFLTPDQKEACRQWWADFLGVG